MPATDPEGGCCKLSWTELKKTKQSVKIQSQRFLDRPLKYLLILFFFLSRDCYSRYEKLFLRWLSSAHSSFTNGTRYSYSDFPGRTLILIVFGSLYQFRALLRLICDSCLSGTLGKRKIAKLEPGKHQNPGHRNKTSGINGFWKRQRGKNNITLPQKIFNWEQVHVPLFHQTHFKKIMG